MASSSSFEYGISVRSHAGFLQDTKRAKRGPIVENDGNALKGLSQRCPA
jgi:hypothetical protein